MAQSKASVRPFKRLLKAAEAVLDGLHARIDDASEKGNPVPVFHGIADLSAAIHQARAHLNTKKGPRG